MNCGTCAHSSDGKMHGFLLCAYMRSWEFVSPHFPCHFTPSRWIERRA